MYHYVYKLIHTETKQYYIGSRTSRVLPADDNYLGSMCVWKPDKSKLSKKILKDDFKTRDEALLYESKLIEDSIEDPLNENYYIPTKGFHTHGKCVVKDQDGKVYHVSVYDDRLKTGELTGYSKGLSIPYEMKKKISKTLKSKNMRWYYNEVTNESLLLSKFDKIPKGFVRGRKTKFKHSDDVKKKMSIAQKKIYKNNPNHTFKKQKGDKHPMWGVPKSEITKLKISNSRKGKNTGANHPGSSKVIQLSLNGEFIREWETIKDAQQYTGATNISRVCRNKKGQSGGFRWLYKKDLI